MTAHWERMKRREFLIAATGVALLPRRRLAAQQGCCRIIGVLAPNPTVFATLNLERDLGAVGWVSGRDYRLLFRASDSRNELLPRLAAELVAQKTDVIFAAGDQAVIAAQQATTAIPIVGIVDDMVGSKLITSMARPGSNTTGISILASELDVKRLQLLHEIVPQASRVGVLADPTTVATGPQLAAAARALNIELIFKYGADESAVAEALDALVDAKLGAVNVLASPILDDQRGAIIERLNAARLPAILQWPESAEAGGLAGYGPRLAGAIRAAVQIIDRVMRGTHPADIPVQQPTKIELAINLKTAKVLGLAMPQSLLARADEVIE
jgi:putative ABC transport system substrate-binding protein